MKLITQNTEAILFEKAKAMATQHDSWRCLYINFSDNREQYSEGLRTHVVTNILKDLLESEDGYVYLCGDGDVFILFQGKISVVLDRLGETFRGLAGGHGTAQPEDELYTIFDLSRHWQIFFTLCKNKAAQAAPEKVKAIQSAPQAAKKFQLPEMDAQLFQAAAARRGNRNRLSILVVEDDAFTRKLLLTTLKNDFDISETDDAASAMRAYDSLAPDIVFLDIELPDASGHVVLGKLLAFDPNAFVVMLSGNSNKENILASLEKGAKGFVTKPFAKEKLMHYLRQCETVRNSKASAPQQHGKAGL